MERTILNIKRRDRVRLSSVKQKLKLNVDVARSVRRTKWRWAGYISRFRDDRWTYIDTCWHLWGKKRKRGKQYTRWKDNINKFLASKKFSDNCESKVQMGTFAGDLCPTGAREFVSPTLGLVYFVVSIKRHRTIFPIKVIRLDLELLSCVCTAQFSLFHNITSEVAACGIAACAVVMFTYKNNISKLYR